MIIWLRQVVTLEAATLRLTISWRSYVVLNADSVGPDQALLDHATTKGGISIFTKALSTPFDSVNAVAPARSGRPFKPLEASCPARRPDLDKDTPLGRAGQPVELAPLYAMLASAELS